MSPECYPWHSGAWSTLAQRVHQLPHALLLHGQQGLGKQAFAQRLARSLLCAQLTPAAEACGLCHSCHLFAAGTHPDLLLIHPLEDSKIIVIDQIRAVGGFLSLRPHTAQHKVVIVSPAEAMNINAANSLLKLLEEPPNGSILLLVTNHSARLPATIRSRCAAIPFKPPSHPEALNWLESYPEAKEQPINLLEQAGGAPLLALQLARNGFLASREQLMQDIEDLGSGREEPIACAARWKGRGTEACLTWLYGFVFDLIKLGMAGHNEDWPKRETGIIKKYAISYKELYKFLDVISESRKLLSGPLDELLLLEDILIRWSRISCGRLQ